MIKSSDLWAKTEPFESVETHLLRTGLICKIALESSSLKHMWRVLKDNIEYKDETNLLNFISYIVAMHDIGKVSPFFQEKEDKMRDLLIEEELNQEYSGVFQHECQSDYYMFDIFEKRGVSSDLIKDLSGVVGLHHERIYYKKGKAIALDMDIENCWMKFVNEIENSIYNYFTFDFHLIKRVKNKDVFFNILQGIIVICDWISSSKKFSSLNIDEIITNPQKIIELLKFYGLGIQKVNWNSIDYSKLLNVQERDFKLRPIQLWTEEYFKSNNFDFMLIEAGTGEGKSSVAFYSAFQNMNVEDGFYLALPMKSMVNSKYFEYSELFKPFNIPITLLHGSRDLIDGVENEYNYIENETNQNVEVNNFLMDNTRKGLLNKYIIGTIDQLLYSVLPNRYSILRLIGLVGKTIILDEVHVYDAYTGHLISILLQWCRALNIKVILMSATLTKALKEKYLKAYMGKEVKINSSAYPLVIVNKNEVVNEYEINGSEKIKSVNLKLFDILDDIESQYQEIKKIYDDNTNIIVYKNTVNTAQELYKRCKKGGIENIILCHSRYTVQDRIDIENKILEMFGKDTSKRPLKYVVISTQVLEAAMDIDLDFGFSDIVPIDVLIQRIGRTCRFDIKGNNRNNFYIFSSKKEDFGVSSLIYPEIFLYNTEKFLRTINNIELPAKLREVIEKVYENIDLSKDDIVDLFLKYKTDEGIKENKGKVSGILPPNPNEFTKLVKDYVLLDENDYKNYIGASTRIFSPSFTVLLIDNNDLLCYNLSKLDKDSYRELMKKTVTLSADCISFEPESGFTKLYFGENKLKNILIMELQNNEYFVKSKKIKGYRYSKELGLEYIK